MSQPSEADKQTQLSSLFTQVEVHQILAIEKKCWEHSGSLLHLTSNAASTKTQQGMCVGD